MTPFLRPIFLAAALLVPSWTLALPVTFNWPPGTLESYKVHGLTDQPIAETRTFDIPEHQTVRVTGPGFDFSFVVDKNAVTFPTALLKDKMGVRFDRKTNSFSFIPVEVTLDIKDCDVPVGLQNIPSSDTDGAAKQDTHSYKVIFGKHQLKFPGALVPFFVDEHGVVTLSRKLDGLTARESVISIRGIPLTITAKDPGWLITRVTQVASVASGTVCLLPNDTGYSFQVGGGQRITVPFFLSADGLLSAQKEGPFEEFTILKDKDGNDVAHAAIPNGEALYQARIHLEKAERETYDTTISTTDAARWKKNFPLRDSMQFYNFADQQISYPLELPADVTPTDLTLLAFVDGTVRSIPFQISAGDKGNTLSFRADLPRGGNRLYRLVAGFDSKSVPSAQLEAPKLEPSKPSTEAHLQNGRISLTVPAGHQSFPGGEILAKVPAPIISITRKDVPALTGSFVAPHHLRVKSIDAKVVASGPLFLIYEITYALQQGKSYTVQLELRANESEVAIAETLAGFRPEDAAFLKLDYSKGLDPNRRLVAANGGYEYYSGDYAKGADVSGKLNYVLTLYAPNSIGSSRATAFYNETGDDALLLAIDRPSEWITSRRAIWGSNSLPENLVFYAKGPEKYLTAGLSGSKRFWALGLIPRAEMTMTTQEGLDAPASGPEARLLNRLTDWSLDGYKNRLAEWDEKLIATPFDAKDFSAEGGFSPVSYEDYVKNYFEFKTFFRWVRNATWDFSSENSPVSFRDMPSLFGQYAVSRASWTPEQRERVRQVLLFIADSSEGDANLPHHSMLAGHPNFVMDVKTVLPLAAATFPTSPRAKLWRDSFMGYYKEWLDAYSRKDVPELNTRGGRWMENIACYVGQCFVGLLDSQQSLTAYDGTSLGSDPQLLAVIRWMRDSFMSPHDGVRMIPPQGAHARAFEPGSKFNKSFFELCAKLAPVDPQLAAEMRWIETNGREGTKPEVKSTLFTDYGPVLHYDFGGPHESYAHLQLLFGQGYRWGNAGIVYYGARNKAWSYNNEDTNGDNFDWNALTAFTVNGKGLARRAVDQLLYDFGFAQFYRQPGETTDAYRARAIMLVRDDYLVLSDEVESPETPGKFNWANSFEAPEIDQLKPGAPMVESQAHDKLPRRKEAPPDRVCHIRSYSGKGDFLTVVAPAPVKAEAKPFGATVNGEYVFASQTPTEVKVGPVQFAGTYGYARPNQLALFQGTSIGLDGFILSREGGDFGLSASMENNRVVGRIVGTSGGKVFLTPPSGLDPAKASVTINGAPVAHTVEQSAISFTVDIVQKDGLKSYEITFR
ncbi:hypothetical protein BH09VER1_BH09VER1_47190 [soil metagenome]